MSERNPSILIMGAEAGQGVIGEPFLDPRISEEEGVQPRVVFYDPNPNVQLNPIFPNIMAAAERGDAYITHTMPQETFDVAVIEAASEHHAEAIEYVLATHSTPPWFIHEKPMAATWEEYHRLRELQPFIEQGSIVNEPYLFSRGVDTLLEYGDALRRPSSDIREIKVWSSKLRSRVNPHGALGTFGIELPHTLGGASLLAGEQLGEWQEGIEENTYFADVDNLPHNDGNYLRFLSNERRVHAAQGLGHFVMNGYGRMKRTQHPPHTKHMTLQYDDGQHVELDHNSAFPRMHTGEYGYSTLWHRDSSGNVIDHLTIPDDPRRELARYVLRCVRDTITPHIPRVTMNESMKRAEMLLKLREQATAVRGLVLDN